MLQISQSQMQALNETAHDKRNRRIADYVDIRFPQVFDDYDEKRKMGVIERMRSAADEFGLKRDDHVGSYIDLFLMYGAGFESQAWAAPILRNRQLSPELKILALKRRVHASGVAI
jgi:hypothetical protein